MSSIQVIGAGAWGTALALQAVRAGAQVRLWARDPARAEAIARTRQNPHLPGVTLPEFRPAPEAKLRSKGQTP